MNCKICSTSFATNRPKQVCCSKECAKKNFKQIKRAYYERNVELVKARAEENRKSNPNRFKEWAEGYRKKNKDRIKKIATRSREKHKESRNEKARKYQNTPERKKYMKEYRNQDGFSEKEKQFKAKYTKKNPNVERNGHLKRTYGIDLQIYESMLQQQGGVCAICKKEESKILRKSGILKALAVDHCHTTGRIRGLLCWNCNTSIGKFKDSIEILHNAIKYLEDSKK